MKMYFRHRDAVGRTFRLRNQSVYGQNIFLYLRGKGKMIPDNMFDIMQTAVMMDMTMFMSGFSSMAVQVPVWYILSMTVKMFLRCILMAVGMLMPCLCFMTVRMFVQSILFVAVRMSV